MDLQAVDLSALAEKIAALCREEATSRGIQIESESIRPVPPVKADRVQIEQVLNNLVANAIDAASERSDARGRVIIRVAARGDTVVMRIEDNAVPEWLRSSLTASLRRTRRQSREGWDLGCL